MKKFSNNAGQPVSKVVVMKMSQGISLLRKLQSNGKVFRVDFTKKDNTLRTMVCRCVVVSKRKGGKAYNFGDKGLLSVWEFGKGYRTVSIDTIELIKYGGVVYAFESSLPVGEYEYHTNSRTVPAKTSPLYK